MSFAEAVVFAAADAAVVIVDYAVTVLVYINALNRLACSVINLLIEVE